MKANAPAVLLVLGFLLLLALAKLGGAKAQDREVRRGVCRYCGCIDDRACPGGCRWLDPDQTVCSAEECFEKFMAPNVESKR